MSSQVNLLPKFSYLLKEGVFLPQIWTDYKEDRDQSEDHGRLDSELLFLMKNQNNQDKIWSFLHMPRTFEKIQSMQENSRIFLHMWRRWICARVNPPLKNCYLFMGGVFLAQNNFHYRLKPPQAENEVRFNSGAFNQTWDEKIWFPYRKILGMPRRNLKAGRFWRKNPTLWKLLLVKKDMFQIQIDNKKVTVNTFHLRSSYSSLWQFQTTPVF